MKPLESASAISRTLLQILETRIELFGVEYRMEKARFAALVGFSCLGAASLVLAGVAAIVAIAFATPEEHQTLVMLVVSGVFLLVVVACVLIAIFLMDQKRTPFTETRRELRKDLECIYSLMRERK